MTGIITLTTAGADTGPFNIFTNVDNYVTPIESNVSKQSLTQGYTSTLIPNTATVVRVKSIGSCTNYIDINIPQIVSQPIGISAEQVDVLGINTTPCNVIIDGTVYKIPSAQQILNNSEVLYQDNNLATLFNGGGFRWKLRILTGFSSNDYIANISSTGIISNIQNC